jgi:hypothetical protein
MVYKNDNIMGTKQDKIMNQTAFFLGNKTKIFPHVFKVAVIIFLRK